ncbi:hypothetical protein MSIMFI_00133 [Mycobacterium simulans]|nr:hypothetical protein MSIMFI_00133 [Mycobacterium simulans]
MATQIEKPVIDTDPRQPQRFGEQPRQHLFAGIARTPIRGRADKLRSRQRLSIYLAVGRHRQRLQRLHRRRHHKLRQPLPHEPTQLGGLGVPGSRFEHHITHQLLAIRGHDRLSHPRMRRQRGFHLAGFDAEAADLDLIISTADKLQVALGIPAHHISSAVHPCPGGTERARHKPRRRQPRLTPIPLRHTGTGDIQLAGHPDGHHTQPGIEHKDAHIANWATNRRRLVCGVGVGQLAIRGMHCGFGNAIHIDQPWQLRPVSGIPPAQPRRAQPLAPEHHKPQCGIGYRGGAFPLRAHQFIERRRGLAEHRDSLINDQLPQLARRAHRLPGHRHHPRTMQQRPPHLPHREIERRGMTPRPYIRGSELAHKLQSREQRHHVTVSDGNGFRGSGGSGGVHDVSQIVRVRPQFQIHTGVLGTEAVQDQPRNGGLGQAGLGRSVGDQQQWGGVGQHVTAALAGVVRINRQIRRPGLRDGQQRGHQLHPAGQGHGDNGLRARPIGLEPGGQPMCPRR